jgi:hypothetical protein
MPLFGSGIVPSAGATAQELSFVTRRGFLDTMPVQIYNTSPTMASMLATSQIATGGVSSVTAPVQGAPFTQTSTMGFDGTFAQPTNPQGAWNAEFNLTGTVTPIQFLGMEGVLQLNHAVVPLIEARLVDSTNNQADFMSTMLFNNFTNQAQWIGLPGAADDGTNLVTYGGLSRTLYPWWQGKVYAAGSVPPTRKLVSQYIVGVTKSGGEMPTFGVMGPGTWQYLVEDYIGAEQFFHRPGDAGFEDTEGGGKAGFKAIVVAGVPIYMDPYCPEGTLYLLNSNYLNLYVHESASFSFSGFESLMSNFVLGYVAVLLTIAQLVCNKPKTQGRVGGFSSRTV